MTELSVRVEDGGEGVRLLVLDAPDRSANTMDEQYADGMDAALAQLRATADLTGVVVVSTKETFFAGGDLRMLRDAGPADAPAVTSFVDRAKGQLRALETLGVPVVAAINGAALGGGLEIALACHARVVVDDPAVTLGLPEVTLGLLPAANGLTRTVRLLGARTALSELLLTGRALSPRRAHELGLADRLVSSRDELLPAARKLINDRIAASAPWDRPGYRVPDHERSHRPQDVRADLAVRAQRVLSGYPMPAPHAILAAACEGATTDFDTASEIETRAFIDLVTGQVATNLIQSQFFDMQAIRSGANRPANVARFEATRIGVVGAGMMGAGIAEVAANAGVDVVLVDLAADTAARARDGVRDEAARARIAPSGQVADLAECDVVIEAVFEDPAVKADIYARLEAVVAADALIASNTSTLPISDLAATLSRPERFIGLHFFSPVPRMRLIEVIPGAATSSTTLARGLDVARTLKKLPIVVGDSRGFYTSRLMQNRLVEAMAMVAEGVDPARIERVAVEVGYPVGPLCLLDEVTVTLVHTVRSQGRAAAASQGTPWPEHPGDRVAAAMVREHRRPGRAARAGFYEYDADGVRGGLWPGLATYRDPAGAEVLDDQTIGDRLLFNEAVNTLHCLAEGVLRTTADANIGSLLGLGFPTWTGGTAQFVAGYAGGRDAFESRAAELAKNHGERFTVPTGWRELVGGGHG